VKKYTKIAVYFLFVVMLLFAMPMIVSAAPAASPGHVQAAAVQITVPDLSTLGGLASLAVQFASLAGFAALVAVLINLLKTVGVVKDGTAGKWSAGLNLIGLMVLLLLRVFVPSLATEQINGIAGQVSTVLVIVLGFVVQFYTSSDVHDALATANIPVIGKSYSASLPDPTTATPAS
jgi:hypothetical protein